MADALKTNRCIRQTMAVVPYARTRVVLRDIAIAVLALAFGNEVVPATGNAFETASRMLARVLDLSQ